MQIAAVGEKLRGGDGERRRRGREAGGKKGDGDWMRKVENEVYNQSTFADDPEWREKERERRAAAP